VKSLQWATGGVPTANLPRRCLEWSLISPASEAISTAISTLDNTNMLISPPSKGQDESSAKHYSFCSATPPVPPLSLLENAKQNGTGGPFLFHEPPPSSTV
jgi:hypothetical protein